MPITYEHKGISAVADALYTGNEVTARSVIDSLAAVSRADRTRSPVGVVVDAWKNCYDECMCTFSINAGLFPRLCTMVQSGSLSSLSLSHFHGNPPCALEVSLCRTPARPGCNIEDGPHAQLHETFLYKALTMYKANPAMESTPTDPAPPPTMTSALNSLSEGQRKLVAAAFSEMESKIVAAGKTTEDMSKKCKVLEEANKIDKSLLKNQLETFLSQIAPSTRDQYGMKLESLSSAMEQDNPDVIRKNVDRMLMCCNQQMMMNARSSNKRKHDETDPETITNINLAKSTEKEPLFEPADTPASSLRQALERFN